MNTERGHEATVLFIYIVNVTLHGEPPETILNHIYHQYPNRAISKLYCMWTSNTTKGQKDVFFEASQHEDSG